jgi:hypothetical protein
LLGQFAFPARCRQRRQLLGDFQRCLVDNASRGAICFSGRSRLSHTLGLSRNPIHIEGGANQKYEDNGEDFLYFSHRIIIGERLRVPRFLNFADSRGKGKDFLGTSSFKFVAVPLGPF